MNYLFAFEYFMGIVVEILGKAVFVLLSENSCIFVNASACLSMWLCVSMHAYPTYSKWLWKSLFHQHPICMCGLMPAWRVSVTAWVGVQVGVDENALCR